MCAHDSIHKGPSRTSKINVGEVEEQNFHFPAVVSVDDTGSSVDEVLRRKAATRSNTTIFVVNIRVSSFIPIDR
jgi:hypothetical protein